MSVLRNFITNFNFTFCIFLLAVETVEMSWCVLQFHRISKQFLRLLKILLFKTLLWKVFILKFPGKLKIDEILLCTSGFLFFNEASENVFLSN